MKILKIYFLLFSSSSWVFYDSPKKVALIVSSACSIYDYISMTFYCSYSIFSYSLSFNSCPAFLCFFSKFSKSV
jgi:hypothetical protein